ncbi:MAG TPA: hypothetical protein VFR73_00595 [Hyphomicrobiaceae bacterium]|nr:hypothetical protein [Hyphomicrobiaceae bacterium]
MAANVVTTVHNRDADRCVKIIKQADGTFGFQEFRRDPEDVGRWTLVTEVARTDFITQLQAMAAAQEEVAWLGDQRTAKRPA